MGRKFFLFGMLLLMVAVSSFAATVDLSKLKKDYVAQDGDVLTGSLNGGYKVSIAKNATVTLNNMSISNADTLSRWAGITCEGNCRIVLKGENSLMGGAGYPGLQAGPVNATLTIEGSGSLVSRGGHSGAGIGCNVGGQCGNITINGGTIEAIGAYNMGAAGIGNSFAINKKIDVICGNITITGGNVTATGGVNAAAIGNGDIAYPNSVTCGNITITGGTVYAKGTTSYANIGTGFSGEGVPSVCGDITISGGTVVAGAIGIGMRYTNGISVCGNITITDDVRSVTVNRYVGSGTSSGTPDSVAIGKITIGGKETGSFYARPYIYQHYYVEYHSNDSANDSVSRRYVYDEYWTIPSDVFTRTGYTFVQWTSQPDGSGRYPRDSRIYKLTNEIDGVKRFYAQWKPNDYSVYFDANRGSGSMPLQSFTYDESQQLAANQFTREGYTFLGWNTSSWGDKISYADGEAVSNLTSKADAKITLYAQWIRNRYTIVFEANDGTDTKHSQQFSYDISSGLGANTFTRDGYVFVGWNTAPDGTGTSYADMEKVSNLTSKANDEVPLYAQWKANDYMVVFEANDGTKAKRSQLFSYDAPQAFDANEFTRKGYVFAGWNTAPDGTGTSYDDETPVPNLTTKADDEVHLYAQWKVYLDFGAIRVMEDDQGELYVDLNRDYRESVSSEIPSDIEVTSVKFNRIFVPGEFATIMLPFDLVLDKDSENVTGLKTVLKLDHVAATEDRTVYVNTLWADTSSKSFTMKAHMPYIIVMKDSVLGITGPVTVKKTDIRDMHDKSEAWSLCGTYASVSMLAELGRAYDLDSHEPDSSREDDFVKIAEESFVVPFSAYLVDDPNESGLSKIFDYPEGMNIVIDDTSGKTEAVGAIAVRKGNAKVNRLYDAKGRPFAGNRGRKGPFYGKIKVIK